MRTERKILLDLLYAESTSESIKNDIIETFPTDLHYKGLCFFAVDDVEKATALLNQHCKEHHYQSYDEQAKEYLPSSHFHKISIFFEKKGRNVEHGKLDIPKLDLFMKKLVQECRLYDYAVEVRPSYC